MSCDFWLINIRNLLLFVNCTTQMKNTLNFLMRPPFVPFPVQVVWRRMSSVSVPQLSLTQAEEDGGGGEVHGFTSSLSLWRATQQWQKAF